MRQCINGDLLTKEFKTMDTVFINEYMRQCVAPSTKEQNKRILQWCAPAAEGHKP